MQENHYKTYLNALEMADNYKVSLFSAAVKVDWIFLINNHYNLQHQHSIYTNVNIMLSKTVS